MGKRWDALEAKGYEYFGCEYDGDAQHEKEKLERQGYDVKLLRARTDTRGLKMFWLFRKEA